MALRPSDKTSRWLAPFLVVGVLVLVTSCGLSSSDRTLEAIRSAIIPSEGDQTSYGLPLSMANLAFFLECADTLELSQEEEATFHNALVQIPAPCCDDHTAYRCCCEDSELSCNLIRSGKGLAALLIVEHGFDEGMIVTAVDEWFRFARPDYYIARELVAQGKTPEDYGVTVIGSCYRKLCNTPISDGGCGGMVEIGE
jgi:hypothetical protein